MEILKNLGVPPQLLMLEGLEAQRTFVMFGRYCASWRILSILSRVCKIHEDILVVDRNFPNQNGQYVAVFHPFHISAGAWMICAME